MRMRALYGCCVGAAFLVCLRGVPSGNARGPGGAATTGVTIDGTSYLSRISAGAVEWTLRRELERLGARFPDRFPVSERADAGNPVYRRSLVASPERGAPVALPPGLTGEHSIRMDGDDRDVELVFGRLAAPPATVTARLGAEGWVLAPKDDGTHKLRLFQKNKGKENAVACLDETDRTFLLIRTAGR